MTLPASGPISFNAINVELAVSGTTQASLGQASYRTLAGVPSGAISMSNFYGKSNRGSASRTFTTGANQSLNITTLPGYVAGNTTVTITISGICYGSGGTPGLTLTGGSGTDTISIINNSYITGSAGAGAQYAGGAGGPALSLGWPVTITNNGYIGGGGGGGGGGNAYIAVNGGNGAGGNSTSGTGANGVGTGGSPYSRAYGTGGGGGWGGNGGTGYAASLNGSATGTAGTGGGAGSNGGNGYVSIAAGSAAGGAGGKAINLNGRSVSWGGPGQVRVYGGIS